MEQVEHITFGNLSEVAARDVGFGRIVQRHSAGKCEEFGGLSFDDMETPWSPEANVTVALEDPSPIDGVCNKITIAGGFTTGLAASHNLTEIDLSGYASIGAYVKSTIAQAAGDLQIGVSETADMGGTPVYMDLPALEAGKWYYVSLDFGGVGTDRDAVLSIGLNVVTDNGACDIYMDKVGVGAHFYGIKGMSAMEEIVDRCATPETYTEGSAVLIVAAGMCNGTLTDGSTVVSEQKLYPVPGGKLTSTEVIMPGRAITATEDQSTRGGRVGVIF